MHTAQRTEFRFDHTASGSGRGFNLDAAIAEIVHWLPTQSPIKDFIHHNTLHAVQHLPFHEGVALAAKVYGACRYLPWADYRSRYTRGRITDSAIDWVIDRFEPVASRQTALRQALLRQDDHEPVPPPRSLAEHGIRQRWLTRIEVNLDALVQPVLFRLIASYLDQGISRWSVVRDDETFWAFVRRLADGSFIPLHPFDEAQRRSVLECEPDAAIGQCLELIVGSESLYSQYLLELMLAHPGWSGMVHTIETAPTGLRIRRQITMKDFLAVEMALERAFLLKKRGDGFPSLVEVPHIHALSATLSINERPDIPLLLAIWQEAMEFSLYAELFGALQAQPRVLRSSEKSLDIPDVQALFCIDDRECSLRRHLEAINPRIETYGVAGFFGIDFLYQGVDDAFAVAQCPANISPRHVVIEKTAQDRKPEGNGLASRLSGISRKPNSLMRGWLFTQTLGVGYAARMAWDVFRPGSRILGRRELGEVKAHTHLHLLREGDEDIVDGQVVGFTHTEMADRIENVLRTIGLMDGFAPLIAVVAHGSSSVNNPHFAAYDCGACSGRPGAPNARAFAWMANDATVRSILRERGIDIPDASRFVAALHNTCRDDVSYFDTDVWKDHPPQGIAAFQVAMREALERNAHERSRWFELGPRADSPAASHAHVRARSASIFEPRPELNHSNNLYCMVGRRELTRQLFLDRRSFLHSYDPDSDTDGIGLGRILQAVIPVCGGINLEYLFSRIDNSVYGAGTKLPHNVIGLLGVANGVEGDLRTGLPSQMIEVHEPARLLITVEQETGIIDAAIAGLGALQPWLANEWVRLAACDPLTRDISLFSQRGWVPYQHPADLRVPTAACSRGVFAGKNESIPVHVLTGGVA
jgi:uncharacterized protein YbcC (UPF0753/DUF2309 family)